MTSTPDGDLSQDAYLGGQVYIWQPKTGYRAGVDAVLLAASCPAVAGDTVLELGCGAGVASACLASRTGAQVLGVERDPNMAALAEKNGVPTICSDLSQLPAEIRNQSFDHVIANPPYYDPHHTIVSAAKGPAHGVDTPLPLWLDVAARRLRPKGWLTLIHRVSTLDDILRTPCDLGSFSILPIAPHAGEEAKLMLIRARKGGRGALRLLPAFVMHADKSDPAKYTPQAEAVLRRGAAVPWPSVGKL